MKPLVIGTRRSALARAQTRIVAERLGALHPGLEIREELIVTEGDRRLDVALEAMIADPAGTTFLVADASGPPASAEAIGIQVAEELLARGGGELMKTVFDGMKPQR